MSQRTEQGRVTVEEAAAMTLIAEAINSVVIGRFSIEQTVIMQAMLLGKTIVQAPTADHAGTLVEVAVANMVLDASAKFPETTFTGPVVPIIEIPAGAIETVAEAMLAAVQSLDLNDMQTVVVMAGAVGMFVGGAPPERLDVAEAVFDAYFGETVDFTAEQAAAARAVEAAGGLQ